MLASVSDEILVKKSQEGDYTSFEELVRRHEKKIYKLAYRLMGNKEDANDVLQETFQLQVIEYQEEQTQSVHKTSLALTRRHLTKRDTWGVYSKHKVPLLRTL